MPNPIRTLARRALTASRYAGWLAASRMLTEGTPREEWLPSGPSERVLVLAPHADDEVFACGGALALRAQRGDSLTVAYLSNGERGTASGEADPALPAVRESEAAAGVRALGFDGAELLWARLPDGTLAASDVRASLEKLLAGRSFDAVFMPWFGDEHPDHVAVGEAALRYFATSDVQLWLYELWSPLPASTVVGFGSVLDRKRAAIDCHASQLTSRGYAEAVLGLNAYRGFQAGIDGPAEAYLRGTGTRLGRLVR